MLIHSQELNFGDVKGYDVVDDPQATPYAEDMKWLFGSRSPAETAYRIDQRNQSIADKQTMARAGFWKGAQFNIGAGTLGPVGAALMFLPMAPELKFLQAGKAIDATLGAAAAAGRVAKGLPGYIRDLSAGMDVADAAGEAGAGAARATQAGESAAAAEGAIAESAVGGAPAAEAAGSDLFVDGANAAQGARVASEAIGAAPAATGATDATLAAEAATAASDVAAPLSAGEKIARVGQGVALQAAGTALQQHLLNLVRPDNEDWDADFLSAIGWQSLYAGVFGGLAVRDRVPPNQFKKVFNDVVTAHMSMGDSAGARAVMDTATSLADEGVARGGVLISKTLGAGSPMDRLLGSPSKYVRQLAQQIGYVPYFLQKNLKGIATPTSAEQEIKAAVSKYKLNLFNDVANSYAAYKTRFAEAATPGAKRLKFWQFGEEVAKAARNKDMHDVPEVADVSRNLRKVFNEHLDQMKQIKDADGKPLIDPDFQLKDGQSYFPRVYDLAAIRADRAGFFQRLTDYFRKNPKGVDEYLADLKNDHDQRLEAFTNKQYAKYPKTPDQVNANVANYKTQLDAAFEKQKTKLLSKATPEEKAAALDNAKARQGQERVELEEDMKRPRYTQQEIDDAVKARQSEHAADIADKKARWTKRPSDSEIESELKAFDDSAGKDREGIKSQTKDLTPEQQDAREQEIRDDYAERASDLRARLAGRTKEQVAADKAKLVERHAAQQKELQNLLNEDKLPGLKSKPGVSESIGNSDIASKDAERELAAGNYHEVDTKAGKVRLVSLENPKATEGHIHAFDSDGKSIGRLEFSKALHQDGRRLDVNAAVADAWKRKGVGSAMYDLAEKHGGLLALNSETGAYRTAEGKAFRDARNAARPEYEAKLEQMHGQQKKQLEQVGDTRTISKPATVKKRLAALEKQRDAEIAEMRASPRGKDPIQVARSLVAHDAKTAARRSTWLERQKQPLDMGKINERLDAARAKATEDVQALRDRMSAPLSEDEKADRRTTMAARHAKEQKIITDGRTPEEIQKLIDDADARRMAKLESFRKEQESKSPTRADYNIKRYKERLERQRAQKEEWFRENGNSEAEIGSRVQAVYDHIMQLSVGHADLEGLVNPKSFRARSLDVPDHILAPYLSNDLFHTMDGYFRSMVPRIKFAQRFGSFDLAPEIDRVRQMYQAERAGALRKLTENLNGIKDSAERDTVKRLLTAAKTDSERAAIQARLDNKGVTDPTARKAIETKAKHAIDAIDKRMAADTRDLAGVRDRVLGVTGPKNGTARFMLGFIRAGKMLRSFNYQRMLGGQTLSALGDYGHVVAEYGLLRTGARTAQFAAQMVSTFTHNLANKAGLAEGAVEHPMLAEARRLGTATELVLNTRPGSLNEIGNPLGGSKIEAAMDKLNHLTTRLTLMAAWSDANKALATILEQDAIKRAITGDVSRINMAKLASHGIDSDTLKVIKQQWDKYGSQASGMNRARTDLWDKTPQAQDAARALENACISAADRVQITVNAGDLPLFMNSAVAQTLLQFRSFGIASVNHYMIPMAQRAAMGDVLHVASGASVCLGLGALRYLAGEIAAGQTPDTSPKNLITQSVMWSGIFGWLPDAANIPMNWMAERYHTPTFSKFSDQKGGAFGEAIGPSLGLAFDANDAITRAAKNGFSEKEAHAIRKLVPWQNLFYIRRLVNAVENSAADAVNAKGAKHERFWQYYRDTAPLRKE